MEEWEHEFEDVLCILPPDHHADFWGEDLAYLIETYLGVPWASSAEKESGVKVRVKIKKGAILIEWLEEE